MATRMLLPLLFVMVCWPSENIDAQSTEPIDSKHIFANADLVFVFQIERLQEHLDMETKAKLDSIHEWLTESIKLDTSKCKEVILQFGADEYDSLQSESVGFVFRGEDDIPEEQISELAGIAGLEQGTHNDRTYYFESNEPAFYFADNSLLIAERARIETLIDTEVDSMNDRDVDILERISRDKDICAHVDFSNESFREFFKGLFIQVPNLRDSETIEKITVNAASATLHVNLDDMIPLRLELEASESADMNELTESAHEFMAALKSYVEMLESELTNAPSQEISDAASEFCKSLNELFAEAEVETDETAVTITIPNGDLAKNVVNEFVTMMGAVVDYFGNM